MTGKDLYPYFQAADGVCTDTRALVPNSIFFALKGDKFNGNEFAARAIEAGCAYAVVDEAAYDSGDKTLLVPDVLEALQDLARHHRKQLTIPVLGITGSNGKTSTKELVSAVLSSHLNTYATKGNLNNHIGVPLSLLQVTSEHDIAVIEMGANHPYEIAELCTMSLPNFGILTNIGKAHLEGFGSIEVIKETKRAVYEAVRNAKGTVFVNGDDRLLMELSEGIDRVTYGWQNGDVRGVPNTSTTETMLGLTWNGHSIQSNLIGDYNFPNIMAALAVGQHFGVPADKAVEAIEAYNPTNNRSQLIETEHNTVVLDAYNANPTSMNAAVINFMRIAKQPPLFILGDMKELGEDSEKEHQLMVQTLAMNEMQHVILVGPEFCKVQRPDRYHAFENTQEAKAFLTANPVKNQWVLVKGSRGIALESLQELL